MKEFFKALLLMIIALLTGMIIGYRITLHNIIPILYPEKDNVIDLSVCGIIDRYYIEGSSNNE